MTLHGKLDLPSGRDQRVDHPKEIVEEAQQVEGKLDPSLALALAQSFRVHDGGRVIQPRA